MKKKIFIPIIIAVITVVLAAIAAIIVYTGKYGKNAPVEEVQVLPNFRKDLISFRK